MGYAPPRPNRPEATAKFKARKGGRIVPNALPAPAIACGFPRTGTFCPHPCEACEKRMVRRSIAIARKGTTELGRIARQAPNAR